MQIVCKHLEALSSIAKTIVETYPQHRIFALEGQMGAGKTTFMQYMAKTLGSASLVSSPTFAIVNQYDIADDKSIFHFDFYRIKNLQEAVDIGFEEYLYSGNYCFIEWAEKVSPLMPDDTITIKIEVDEQQNRIFTF